MARVGVAVVTALAMLLSGFTVGYNMGFNQGFFYGGIDNIEVLRTVQGTALLWVVFLAIGIYGLWRLRRD